MANHFQRDDLAAEMPAVSLQSWQSPDFQMLRTQAGVKVGYRFFRVDEIIEEKNAVHRQAMANVIACLNNADVSMLYMVRSDEHGVKFYVGVAGEPERTTDSGKMLEQAFAGNFLGARLHRAGNHEDGIGNALDGMTQIGVVSGIPSFNEDEHRLGDVEFQGVERLVNSLSGEPWSMIVVAQPGSSAEVLQIIEQIYDYSTALSSQLKLSVQESSNAGTQHSHSSGRSQTFSFGENQSVNEGESETRGKSSGYDTNQQISSGKGESRSQGSNESETQNKGTSKGDNSSVALADNSSTSHTDTQGSSLALTRERTSKHCEELLKHLSDTQLPRFRQGHSKGMFRTAIYLCATSPAVFQRLSHSVLSIFQGNQASMTPLRVHRLPLARFARLSELLRLHDVDKEQLPHAGALVHSLAVNPVSERLQAATWLNGDELSLLMGFPGKELPGIKIRKSADFALNVPELPPAAQLPLGNVIQHGRELSFKQIYLPRKELDKHIFITGVTGAGKTTTCMRILLESGLPFMVIEPAKTEYRALHEHSDEVVYYALGREDLTPFRLNPFELVSPFERLSSHIEILKNTLAAVYPMEAAMPYIVEEAIILAYRRRGWDIHANENYLIDEPFAVNSGAWPNFSDLIAELSTVILSKKMGVEFEQKYQGSLVARLTNLTLGTKGRMLNCRHSLDFVQMLGSKVVIELDEIKDESDKALFMGLIISRMAECIKQTHRGGADNNVRHLTLVEEAHRLLSKPEPGDDGGKKLGVNMFCNLLAEVRKYGAGLIVADQIPNKLVPDVIKNTNIKIVHRLFSADDRNVIGDAMSLNDEQKNHLPLLEPGQAVVYAGGWHGAVLLQVDRLTDTNGAVLDEQVMREQGARQLERYRHRIFPRLADGMEFASPLAFMDFQRHASQMLGLLLRAMSSYEELHSKDTKAERQRLIDIETRLREKAALFRERWQSQLADTQLAAALAAQFEDEYQVSAGDNAAGAALKIASWLLAPQGMALSDLADLARPRKAMLAVANMAALN